MTLVGLDTEEKKKRQVKQPSSRDDKALCTLARAIAASDAHWSPISEAELATVTSLGDILREARLAYLPTSDGGEDVDEWKRIIREVNGWGCPESSAKKRRIEDGEGEKDSGDERDQGDNTGVKQLTKALGGVVKMTSEAMGKMSEQLGKMAKKQAHREAMEVARKIVAMERTTRRRGFDATGPF